MNTSQLVLNTVQYVRFQTHLAKKFNEKIYPASFCTVFFFFQNDNVFKNVLEIFIKTMEKLHVIKKELKKVIMKRHFN